MSWEPTALFEALDDAVSVFDADLRWVYANAAAAKVSGIVPADLIGKRVWDVFPDGKDTEFYIAFERTRATGASQIAESYYAPLDRWFRIQTYRVGEYIFVVSRDITEQKQGEARLLVLSRASHAFARVAELEPMFEVIARTLAELVGDACIVRMLEHGKLRPVAVHHPDPERQTVLRQFFATPFGLREGLSVKVLESGEPLLVEHLDRAALRNTFTTESHRMRVESGGVHSVMASALSHGAQRVGVVTLLRDRTARPYTRGDLSLLQDLADRASMAVSRARLYEDAQQERRRALAAAAASRSFSAAERDTHAVLDLLARATATEVGEIAVAAVVSEDGQYLQPVGCHANSEIADEIRAKLTARAPVAGSMSERVMATRKPLRMANLDVEAFAASAQEQYRGMVHRFQPRSFMLVPIIRSGHALGTLFVSRQDSFEPYSDDDERLLLELAERAGIAVSNGRVLEAERLARLSAERVAEHTRRLQTIGAQLSHRRSPREVAETILRESTEMLGGDAAGTIWLLGDSETKLEVLAHVGLGVPEQFTTLPLDSDIPLVSAIRSQTPLFIANLDEYTARFPSSARRVAPAAPAEFAVACVPLVNEGRAIGGFSFMFPHAHVFLPDERTFLEVIATQCAQAIDRAQLLAQEQAATAALAETNRTLNALIHASPAAIIMFDLDGAIRLWNPAAERIFGWAAADVLGKPWPLLDKGQQAERDSKIAQIARGQELRGFETKRPRRDGTQIDVAVWAAPVQRPDGEAQVVALFVDITDRKHAEELARAADRRKDEFLAMLGHELRNPLAPILTALELMRIRKETGGEHERATIERQTRHLVRLVDDLLDISRITRGTIELRKSRVDLGAAIAHALEMASPLLEQRGHHVSIAAPRGLVYVDGDEIRLAQVFQNLLTNAAKYTPTGGSITARLTVRDNHALAEIEDNGVGIAPSVLPTIFEPFVQGAQKLDRSQGGLGIGLTLVRSIVDLHGGRVEAHSAGPGHGSRFTVTLPQARDHLRDVQGTPQGMVPLRGIKRRVLVVDDNRDAAEMLAELLRAAGHEVAVAYDAPTALSTLPSFKPEIALLDIGLPVMDGYDLARKLKAALPNTPRLVAITGYGQEHDRRRSEEAGFDEHLVKPVQAAQVLAAVDAVAS
ncbi:MAG TPA: GAF domain-containing protein [Kofleriaceae bacterium]|nr:GAF domain-containing protein [Kofleriaceae bacterium]